MCKRNPGERERGKEGVNGGGEGERETERETGRGREHGEGVTDICMSAGRERQMYAHMHGM